MVAAVERWRPVAGYEATHMVSDQGRVLSMARMVPTRWGGARLKPAKILKHGLHTKGYPQVGLRANGRNRTALVHSLVLLSFCGPRPRGFQASHINGDKGDNRAANLAWESPKQNNRRKIEHGTQQIGERNSVAKFTAQDVIEIRRARAAGERRIDVAARFGTSPGYVYDITSGKAWSHLMEPQDDNA